jgi:uncharacterized protein YegL
LSRRLRFFWVLDVSGSMAGAKIGQLNHAIREALPAMKASAAENVHTTVEVRAMTFGKVHRWASPATLLEDFSWSDVSIRGISNMGAAMKALAAELSPENMPARGLPPVVVLVSDGRPTDDVDAGLEALLAQPWGSQAVRIAIAIGDDADLDVLRRFIGRPEMEPLVAHNSADLATYITWTATTVLDSASAPAARDVDTDGGATVTLPVPPAATAGTEEDVW